MEQTPPCSLSHLPKGHRSESLCGCDTHSLGAIRPLGSGPVRADRPPHVRLPNSRGLPEGLQGQRVPVPMRGPAARLGVAEALARGDLASGATRCRQPPGGPRGRRASRGRSPAERAGPRLRRHLPRLPLPAQASWQLGRCGRASTVLHVTSGQRGLVPASLSPSHPPCVQVSADRNSPSRAGPRPASASPRVGLGACKLVTFRVGWL